MITNFFITASRNFLRNKTGHALNIFGLAIGLATVILIAMWVYDELSFDRFHNDRQDIYVLVNEMGNGWWYASPYLLTEHLKEDFPEVEMTARVYTLNRLINYRENQFREFCGFVDPELFKMFNFPLIRGNVDHIFDVSRSVVLSERAAFKYFGDESPVGKYLEIANRGKYLVSGIMKNFPANSSIQFDILFPFQDILQQRIDNGWTLWSYDLNAYIKLKPEANVDAFREKMAGTCNKYDPRPGSKNCVNDIQRFDRQRLHILNGTPGIVYIYILSLIAGFILIIACVNFINLTTAYSSIRSKEIGIRKVNGANRSSLIRKFLGEAVLTSYVAMGIALLVVWGVLPDVNTIMGKEMSLASMLKSGFLVIVFLLPLITGIISGIFPAFVLSSLKPVESLSFSLSPSSSGILRKSLVVFQFAIAIVIMICTWVTYNQLTFILNRDLGFTKENILVLRNNRTLAANFSAFQNEVIRDGNVDKITWAQSQPLQFTNNNTVYKKGQTSDDDIMVNDTWVGDGYIDLFNMQIVEGRDFYPSFLGDSTSCIVNEELVNLLDMDNPVGQTIYHFPGDTLKVIGVVKNFHAQSLHAAIPPVIILPNPQPTSRYVFIRVTPYADSTTIRHIHQCWSLFSGNYPFEIQYLTESFQRQYQSDAQLIKLFRYFTFIAIILSLLGLVGLAAFMIKQRTKEIALRKVFGASIVSISRYLSGKILILILLANLIAWPAAYMLSRYILEIYVYKTAIQLWMFLIVGMISMVLTFLVIGFHTFKAASRNPSESLKYE